MVRPRALDPVDRLELSFPRSLLAEIEIRLWDNVRQKPKHGDRAQLFRRLAQYWVSGFQYLPIFRSRIESASSLELLSIALEIIDKSPVYNSLTADIRTRFINLSKEQRND
jgi:hypothetical protein